MTMNFEIIICTKYAGDSEKLQASFSIQGMDAEIYISGLKEDIQHDFEISFEIENKSVPSLEDYNRIMRVISETLGVSLSEKTIKLHGYVCVVDVVNEDKEINQIIEVFLTSFDDSQRAKDIEGIWDTARNLSYKSLDIDTTRWMTESLKEAAISSLRRIRKVWAQRGYSGRITWQQLLIPHLEYEEHFLWLAELASISAPDDKEAQQWMLS